MQCYGGPKEKTPERSISPPTPPKAKTPSPMREPSPPSTPKQRTPSPPRPKTPEVKEKPPKEDRECGECMVLKRKEIDFELE
jgi:hypothetical protein